MSTGLLLKIMLPHTIFLEEEGVESVQVETAAGSHGFLPQRLDCTAPLPPGLITYIKAGEEHYVAVDKGILVKAGNMIAVAVRNAMAGSDLGALHKRIDEQFRKLDELEQESRRTLSYLESGFVRNFERLIVDSDNE